jgi:DnaA family protein
VSQLLLDFGPPPAPTLANFVAGRNVECLAALGALLRQLHQGEPPTGRFVYVWGTPGTGKSHLAAALRAQGLSRLTVVDDCQLLAADGQRELFHRFDAMTQAPGLALVAFGDRPPARLPVMPELASRLGWGIVFLLEPLADDELEVALERAARDRGLPIGTDVIDYLLRHTRRDMSGLKALLDGLDRLSLERQRPVTLALLRALLEDGREAAPQPLPDRMP